MGPPGTPALAETDGFQEFIGWPATEAETVRSQFKERERDSTSCSSLHVCALTYVHTYTQTNTPHGKTIIKSYTYINTPK